MTKSAFEPHRLNKAQIRPLNNSVIVSDMLFDQRITSSGIILPNDNGTGSGIRPRWGQVYATGPDQTDVKIGQWVCVAHGRWTRGIDIQDENGKKTLRRIDPDDILIVSDTFVEDDTMSDAVNVAKKER